ncbi:hypothetical protein COU58_01275 [Candidatus Pacearchaeota archaeon CG10_big_fil_rev_8_21_14_0_10_32_42]|nr:MAG: hypothetical protein COU58_01275 [Candidatus Pacearchaeota archaeon CG10_big_fil_rev_8_21_14_0_10_32_42]
MSNLKNFLEEQYHAFVSLENLKKYSGAGLKSEYFLKKINYAKKNLEFITTQIEIYDYLSPRETEKIYQKVCHKNRFMIKYELGIAKKVKSLGYYIEQDGDFVLRILGDQETPSFLNCIIEQTKLVTYIENLAEAYFFLQGISEGNKEMESLNRHLEVATSLKNRATFVLSKCTRDSNSEELKNLFLNEKNLNKRLGLLQKNTLEKISFLGFEIIYSGDLIEKILKK